MLRLEQVERLLRECKTSSAIQQQLATEWHVTHRQVRVYIQKVYERWQEEAKAEGPLRREQRRAQLEGILEIAVFSMDLKSACVAIDRLCRIDGVYAPIEHNIHTSGRDLAMMTSQEKRQALAEIFTRAAESRTRRDVKPDN